MLHRLESSAPDGTNEPIQLLVNESNISIEQKSRNFFDFPITNQDNTADFCSINIDKNPPNNLAEFEDGSS